MATPHSSAREQQLLLRSLERASRAGPLATADCHTAWRVRAGAEPGGATHRRCTEMLVEAVAGVVTNEVASQLKTRGGTTFREGHLLSFDELVNEAHVHVLGDVIERFDVEHPDANWPGYVQRRVRAHLRDVLRDDEYDERISGRELTVLLAVKKRLDADPTVSGAPTRAQLEAAVAAYLEDAIEERMARDGLDRETARRRVSRNSGFRVADEIVAQWQTFTRGRQRVSLEDPVNDHGTTLGDLLDHGGVPVEAQAERGMERPAFDELVNGLLTDGVEVEHQAVLEDLVEQRCASERAGRDHIDDATITGAVRRTSGDLERLRSDQRDAAVRRRAKRARNRRAAVAERAASPHGQWAFLARELDRQLVGDWDACAA